MPRTLRILLILLTLIALSGTSALAYVHQRTGGQHPLRWADTLVHFVIQSEGAPGINDGSDLSAVRTGFEACGREVSFWRRSPKTATPPSARGGTGARTTCTS